MSRALVSLSIFYVRQLLSSDDRKKGFISLLYTCEDMAQAKMLLKVHLILINFLLFRISLTRCLPPPCSAMCLELYRVNRINLLNLLCMAHEILRKLLCFRKI